MPTKEEAEASPYYTEELAVLRDIPDGEAYYEHILENVQLDRSNPKNSYYMFIHGKVDTVDLTRPCAFTDRATALPDIDVDFPTDYREKAIDYVRTKYGRDKVCQITTFGRYSGRSALKAVMRAESSIDHQTANDITEYIPDEAAVSDQLEAMDEPSVIRWALESGDDKLKEFARLEEDEIIGDYANIFKKALRLEGTFQNQGKHAAGVIISSDVISDVSPMCLGSDGTRIAALDMGDLEKIGLVKFDFLGVDILNKIQEVLGTSILNAPLDDPAVWETICSGNTKGIFQIENKLGRDWAEKLQPHNIKELAALISIIRPGCVSGDTPIAVMSNYISKINGKKHIKYVPLKQIIANRGYYKQLRSVDESTGEIVNNTIIDIFATGEKECFRLKVRRYRKLITRSSIGSNQYPLECTDDHKLLTPDGWKELKDIQIGERIAARKLSAPKKIRSNTIANRHIKGARYKNISGLRNFSEICYKNYIEECCICGWNKANLDTNHIEGNRHTDNSPDNLCFMCPNCHREFTLGYISKEKLIESQLKNKLPKYEDLEWLTYEGKESVGVKEVYDIAMNAPYHNFVAGNILVHNCLMAKHDDGRNMTQLYCDRKNGEAIPDKESNKVIDTYGVLIYQETLLKIAKDIAGFNSAESIKLMKSVGKKDAKLLFSLEDKFLNGCKKIGVISDNEAKELFNNIKRSSRYLFNASHAVSYSYPAYWAAYIKTYKPLEFYKTWLTYSSSKIKPQEEVRALVMSARADNIEILPPSCHYLDPHFFIHEGSVVFGLTHIKGVSLRELIKLFDLMKTYGVMGNIVSYLTNILPNINKRTVDALISCGCFQYLKISRAKLSHLYECICGKDGLTDKEIMWINERNFTNIDDALTCAARSKKDGGACATLSRVTKMNNILERIRNPGRDLSDLPSKIAATEEAAIGIPLSCSYLDSCLSSTEADTTCKEAKRKPGKMTLKVRITEVKEHIIAKSGKTMAFVTVEDDSGELDNLVVFADKYEAYGSLLFDGAFVAILGSGEFKNCKRSVIVDRVIEL